jgi:hypothetical protein
MPTSNPKASDVIKPHQILVDAMRRALSASEVIEVTASGEFTLPATRPSLFPGGVYGFGAELSQGELLALFEEARARKLARVANLEDFRPIEGKERTSSLGLDRTSI